METNPTVPKAVGVIQVREIDGELTAQDRKAFNWLLMNAFDNIEEQVTHKAQIRDLRRYLGSHESNDRVIESTKKLGSVRLEYDYIDGGRKWGTGSLVSISGSEVSGEILYDFPHWLRPILANPAKWARISLQILQKFKSKYAVTLYENLEVHTNKRVPSWKISIADLRIVLGVPESKLTSYSNFKARALDPALLEVNEHADFNVEYKITKRWRKKALELEFIISKKARRLNSEKTAKDWKKEVKISGETLLKQSTLEHVKNKVAPAMDVYAIIADWEQKIATNGKPNNPDGAFIRFAEKWYKNHMQGEFLI